MGCWNINPISRYLLTMRDIELYNKYLDKKVFEIENPMGFHLPGHPAKVKMKVIGEKEYITGGNKVNFLTYEITVLPSGAINRLIDVLMDNKKYKELTTTTRILSELRWKCNEKLQSFLSLMGEDTPTISIGITNEYTKNMNESLIKESKCIFRVFWCFNANTGIIGV